MAFDFGLSSNALSGLAAANSTELFCVNGDAFLKKSVAFIFACDGFGVDCKGFFRAAILIGRFVCKGDDGCGVSGNTSSATSSGTLSGMSSGNVSSTGAATGLFRTASLNDRFDCG